MNIYLRGKTYWIQYTDQDGKRRQQSLKARHHAWSIKEGEVRAWCLKQQTSTRSRLWSEPPLQIPLFSHRFLIDLACQTVLMKSHPNPEGP